ncbi:hypothetical protein HaLaN_21796, partial [Haematococcus lacustris]
MEALVRDKGADGDGTSDPAQMEALVRDKGAGDDKRRDAHYENQLASKNKLLGYSRGPAGNREATYRQVAGRARKGHASGLE